MLTIWYKYYNSTTNTPINTRRIISLFLSVFSQILPEKCKVISFSQIAAVAQEKCKVILIHNLLKLKLLLKLLEEMHMNNRVRISRSQFAICEPKLLICESMYEIG